MTPLSFDPDNTLSGGLSGMSPREAIALAMGLCDAVEGAVGADGCHCGIWPGNLTVADGQVAIGPVSSADISEMEPDALEFVAPEQFWSGERTPAGDVYSIGLILYTALNDGVMPFFTAGEEHTPEIRAAALQSRMKGKALPYPASASRELGDVVLKAAAFRAADRYATPGRLKAALSSLAEGAALPAAAPVIPMTRSELENARSYKVDKHFEPAVPDRPRRQRRDAPPKGSVDENMDAEQFRKAKKKGRWVLPLVLLVVIAAAAFLLLRGCSDENKGEFPVSSAPPVTPNVIHPPVSETTLPTPPVQTTPKPTETPAPTPTAEPTYEFVKADVSWMQARELADQKGGHLATVRSEEEFNKIVELAGQYGAQFVWLGAYRAGNAQWYYVTGDTLDYTNWDTNEPSAVDLDGTHEDYLLLWYRPAVGYWSYNDMRNDPVAAAPAAYTGKLGYVIQYDN